MLQSVHHSLFIIIARPNNKHFITQDLMYLYRFLFFIIYILCTASYRYVHTLECLRCTINFLYHNFVGIISEEFFFLYILYTLTLKITKKQLTHGLKIFFKITYNMVKWYQKYMRTTIFFFKKKLLINVLSERILPR